jgi:uncharacterized protein with von Willebrand factor type A (vWA) domain
MLIDFFFHLRAAKLKVSINELLTLLEALKQGVIGPQSPEGGLSLLDEFYHLSRTTLVKDETQFDKFDRAFGEYFKGVTTSLDFTKEVPEEWFRKVLERAFSPEEIAKLEKLGWDKLMEEFRKRLDEQDGAHHGGNRWIGSGGTSPFGHGGANPEGIRVGGPSKGGKSAVKVWEMRGFRDYDDSVEIGTRNIKVALRRLRRFAREGADLELDMHDTIESTAKNAGWLDLKLVPERHNTVKVLMLLDVGGTMDEHIKRTEELFSAAKGEFKHLEFYYFHNCVYEYLWRNNRRRYTERFATWDVLRKYPHDWKLVFVGDATMSPYEVLQPGGSVEYNNEEAGAVWLQRIFATFPKSIWLNPEPESLWQYRQSISLIRQLAGGKMFPMTLEGLTRAMRQLSK